MKGFHDAMVEYDMQRLDEVFAAGWKYPLFDLLLHLVMTVVAGVMGFGIGGYVYGNHLLLCGVLGFILSVIIFQGWSMIVGRMFTVLVAWNEIDSVTEYPRAVPHCNGLQCAFRVRTRGLFARPSVVIVETYSQRFAQLRQFAVQVQSNGLLIATDAKGEKVWGKTVSDFILRMIRHTTHNHAA